MAIDLVNKNNSDMRINMNEKEMEYDRLVINIVTAKNDAEIELAKKKIEEFEKKNPELLDDIRNRKWTPHGHHSIL